MNLAFKKLDDCLELITYGFTNPMPDTDSGPWKVTAKDIVNGRIDYSTARHTSEDAFENALTDKSRPIKDDILLTKDGTLGRLAIVSNDKICINQSVALLRVNNEILLPEYLYFLLSTPEYQGKILADAGGATIKHIYITRVNQLMIPVPTLSKQKRLVDIINTYDKLIDNCNKQIKLLEEAVQRLYKEWFVDLRFTGYEEADIIDKLPDEWKTDRADSFFNISIGKTPPRAEQQWFVDGDVGIPWLSISDMGSSGTFIFETSEGLTEEAIIKHNMKVAPSGTIFVSFKLTVGRVAIATKDICTNEAIAHFYIEDDKLRSYAYCYLKNFEYDTLGNTSSISKAVNSKIIKAMPFIMPKENVILAFSEQVDPIMNAIRNKQETIGKLAEARDRLLPKLMSGEIEV